MHRSCMCFVFVQSCCGAVDPGVESVPRLASAGHQPSSEDPQRGGGFQRAGAERPGCIHHQG